MDGCWPRRQSGNTMKCGKMKKKELQPSWPHIWSITHMYSLPTQRALATNIIIRLRVYWRKLCSVLTAQL